MFKDEFEEYHKQHPPFEPVIDALLDETNPFPASYLHRFSDISEGDLEKVSRIWEQISLVRRRALLEDLEEILDKDTLVSFNNIGQFALQDADAYIRCLGIRLLWEAEDLHLGPVFLKMLLNDSDADVRATSANALGYFVYQGELELISAELLNEIEDALLNSCTNGATDLEKRLALESLGYSSRSEVPPLIEAAFDKPTPEWKASALYAMGRSADAIWKTQVLDSLSSRFSTVRAEAARATGELDLSEARDPLMDMVEDDEDDDVRMAALWSLSQIGGEGVRDMIEEAIDASDDDEEIELLENALDNLAFTEDAGFFSMIDYDDDPEDFIEESLTPEPEEKKTKNRKKGKGE